MISVVHLPKSAIPSELTGAFGSKPLSFARLRMLERVFLSSVEGSMPCSKANSSHLNTLLLDLAAAYLAELFCNMSIFWVLNVSSLGCLSSLICSGFFELLGGSLSAWHPNPIISIFSCLAAEPFFNVCDAARTDSRVSFSFDGDPE
ncbi:Aquaporin Z [Parendozoicomonas haliclonae]|uniref:Uncharacterized protein n=1 Tax=Parendozoicomonas haliclonae TaxID=1960125 RepID=A0A1X7AQP6_9GAMM|nr:hypothetical protein EHSB41UT_04451 [Parendozoicomonas haliclonae]